MCSNIISQLALGAVVVGVTWVQGVSCRPTGAERKHRGLYRRRCCCCQNAKPNPDAPLPSVTLRRSNNEAKSARWTLLLYALGDDRTVAWGRSVTDTHTNAFHSCSRVKRTVVLAPGPWHNSAHTVHGGQRYGAYLRTVFSYRILSTAQIIGKVRTHMYKQRYRWRTHYGTSGQNADVGPIFLGLQARWFVKFLVILVLFIKSLLN